MIALKPCKHCNKALPELSEETFEQECDGTCPEFDQYMDEKVAEIDKFFTKWRELLDDLA